MPIEPPSQSHVTFTTTSANCPAVTLSNTTLRKKNQLSILEYLWAAVRLKPNTYTNKKESIGSICAFKAKVLCVIGNEALHVRNTVILPKFY